MTTLLTLPEYNRRAKAISRADWPELRYEYYSQFLTQTTLTQVRTAFDLGDLPGSIYTDPDTIAPPYWQRVVSTSAPGAPFAAAIDFDRADLDAAGQAVTLAALVQIAKAAATRLSRTNLLSITETTFWKLLPTELLNEAASQILVGPDQHVAWVKTSSQLSGILVHRSNQITNSSTASETKDNIINALGSGDAITKLRRLGVTPIAVEIGARLPAGTIDVTRVMATTSAAA